MNQQLFNDLFTLLLSGAGKLNEHGEVEWIVNAVPTYFSFPTLSPNYVVTKVYYKDGWIEKELHVNGELIRQIWWNNKFGKEPKFEIVK